MQTLSRRGMLKLIGAQAVLPSIPGWSSAFAGDSKQHKWPLFSWDRVPVYQDFGKSSGDFTNAEAQFLAAHYDFISLEKGQGLQKYGSTEAGAAAAARQLKAINPRMCILYYWNGALDWADLYAATKNGLPEGFLLKKPDGQYLDVFPGVHRYDLSNPAMREWWLSNAVRNVMGAPFGGIFVDAIARVADSARIGGLIETVGAQKVAAMQRGMVIMLEQLKERLGPDKIIVFNDLKYEPSQGANAGDWKNGGMEFLNYASGTFMEDFLYPTRPGRKTETPAHMAGDLELARECVRRGKIAILKGWPTFNWRLEPGLMKQPHDALYARAAHDITFPLACFLVCAGEHSYFDYSWGYQSDMGALDWYPEFDKPLGPPKHDAIRNGLEFHREFAHASVSVDLYNRKAQIDWR